MKWKNFLNISLKILVLMLVVHAIIYSDLAQYQNKGMNYRLIAYPLGVFSVIIYRYFFKKTKTAYPYNVDILITTIIALDMLGNALGFYGSIEWWDDIMHLINSALLTLVSLRILRTRLAKDPLMLGIAAVGAIACLQIVWELAEYVTFVTTNTCEFPTAYRDTIGDLLFGQIGAILTVLFVLRTRRYKRK